MQNPKSQLSNSPNTKPAYKFKKRQQQKNSYDQYNKFINQKHYDVDVIQVSNIALAIKSKEHTINIQLSVRCENLPIMKTFGSTDSMIVIYKSNDFYDQINQKDEESQQSQQNYQTSSQYKNSFHNPNKKSIHRRKSKQQNYWIQIGRTQIISNQINPKFIKTFVFSHKQDKQQKIQFRIYDIIDYSRVNDLNEQVQIGSVTKSMQQIVDNDHGQFQIELDNKKKGKAILKTNCAEYDSGNSKYQIDLELSNFQGKLELFYIIQVLKLNQWIPIAKSQPIEVKKNQRFKQTQISYSKFPSQDSSRIKIKIYQTSKGKSLHSQELGSTDQLTIINILTTDDKVQTQRVYKNGFVVGVIKINKWRKVIRDSFISYIVNGATLHLILGIDFSNSNSSNGTSLHHIQNGRNPYIDAIRKIIGVLQYFDYYNQIALYGYGAQLPPYYRSVSQCFALNGNYFNPIVVGGVQEIVRLYMENLQKNKLHGPTKFSQMIDLAIQYAQAEQNSSNYYVLILMTDGQINDFIETKQRIVKASTLPLSIVIVGVGDKDFPLIEELDSDKQILKNQNGQACERDIVDFIQLNMFKGQKGDTLLARQTFAQIPAQFIDYMMKKNIKPNRQKKSLKVAKQDFITQKIKQSTNFSYDNKSIVVIPQFLEYEKKKMKKVLIQLGFDPQDPLLKDLSIAMNDISYFIQVHSHHKKVKQKISNVTYTKISQKQQKTLQQYLDKNQLQNKKKTLQKVQKIQANQYGRQRRKKQQQIKQQKKIIKRFVNPCLKCRDNQINILHIECGHLALCYECRTLECFICGYRNSEMVLIDGSESEDSEDDQYEEEEEDDYEGQQNDGSQQEEYNG